MLFEQLGWQSKAKGVQKWQKAKGGQTAGGLCCHGSYPMRLTNLDDEDHPVRDRSTRFIAVSCLVDPAF
jgi:hypothetical protein